MNVAQVVQHLPSSKGKALSSNSRTTTTKQSSEGHGKLRNSLQLNVK
jgi:hypothetical protein